MLRQAVPWVGVSLVLGLSGCGGSAIPTAVSSERSVGLKLELSDSPLAVQFVNTSDKPIRILKPSDGSEWCWIMPYYKLTVTDTLGREIPRAKRCGNFGSPYFNTKWPDDYLVAIPPGTTYQHPLCHSHELPAAGTYTLRFEYVFTPDIDTTPDGPYPPDLWRGEVSSNSISAHLTPDN